jgi:outer membrane protein assembly factor BamB/SAM-dependent methyltransferase
MCSHQIRRAVLFCMLPALASTAHAADWPMWRYDAARGNASPDALPAKLHSQWTLQLPPPRPAWPASQTKLQFDADYQPIVVGKLLIVGSTVNDSVKAYETKTGKLAWQFFTDAPVRFAPAALGGRVYAASDDGFLYCLEAATGKLLWKFNGGPDERRIIGNERLVSSWPIRGGPVIADGTVYFTASIWPFMGIFIHAVDSESGKRVWTNSETGSRWVVHPHGAPSFGSIVPQGYLAASGDSLIVPGGRSLPAVFDRATGTLRHFQFGGKGSGGWNVVAHENFYVVNNTALSLSGGQAAGSLQANVLTDKLLVGPTTAFSLVDAVRATDARDRRGQPVKRVQIAPKQSWPVTSDGLRVFAMSGHRAYAGGKGKVASYDVDAAREAGKALPPEWTAEIEGNVAAILAGDDRLFVVTDDSKIHCFGADPTNYSTIVRVVPETKREPKWVQLAEKLLKKAGTADGFALAIGIGSGQLIEEIVAESKLHVIVLDADAAAVDAFRRRMDDAGLYGTRVDAHVGSLQTFHLPPYLFNLVFSEDLKSAKKPAAPADFVRSMYRVLRPYGGVAGFEPWDYDYVNLSEVGRQAKLPIAVFGEAGSFVSITRPGSLPGSSTWSHQYADAANSVVSKDKLVRAPLGLLWFGGPSNDRILPRHGHGPSPQVAGGRLVIEGPDMLRCVDVYSGRVLWERELPGLGSYYDNTGHFPGAGEIGSNYVTTPEAVYAVYGEVILDLNAKTGQTQRQYKLEAKDGASPNWGFLASEGDLLVATSSPVTVSAGAAQPNVVSVPRDMTAIVKRGAAWQYLAGTDTTDDWTDPDYKLGKEWKTGPAGFGYGDGDDRTVLSKCVRLFIRNGFDREKVEGASKLTLAIRYDDAFIAYLNGKEVIRAGVGKGRGHQASRIVSHEAAGLELFEIKDFSKLLRAGENVLAIEGHNVSARSSDFTLDPILLVDKKPTSAAPKTQPQSTPPDDAVAKSLTPARYSSASRRLIVFNRHTGEKLWERTAEFNFRHNCIAISGGKLFCIDSLSAAKMQALARRGIAITAKPRLLALDAKTGTKIWSTDQNVFGTFLNYSVEHDVLLQAGSAYRDRARDEARDGMVAYRGSDGKVLWKDLSRSHGGPCLLWRDKIITNGGGGSQLDLLTGKATGWNYKRMYGCNTAVGSEHLLTFRSGAAGFCDLAGDSGTGNIGGFRSSCTANLIVADGVLNAPDYTRTCSCAYQNQCSLALVHMPEAEMWTFSNVSSARAQFGLNIGGPGDRRSADGNTWYDFPSVGGNSPDLRATIKGAKIRFVRHHGSRIDASSAECLPWIAASCAIGLDSIEQQLGKAGAAKRTARLHFAELENLKSGERVFHVSINGQRVLENFDIAAAAGGAFRAVVREFPVALDASSIMIEFHRVKGDPCIGGVEVNSIK